MVNHRTAPENELQEETETCFYMVPNDAGKNGEIDIYHYRIYYFDLTTAELRLLNIFNKNKNERSQICRDF